MRNHFIGTKIAVMIFLVFTFLSGACSEDDQTPEAAVTSSAAPIEEIQSIVVGLAAAPFSENGWALDPADHRHRSSETVIRNMFDGLVTRDTGSGVHMDLAEEMNWLNEKTLEISIRQGVLFHDGVEMTADDVVFTFNRIITEDAIEYPQTHTSPRKSLVAPLESIEKVDDYTVVMNFSGSWPPYLQLLVHQQIVPKHHFEKVGTQGFIDHPIGTGPFEFVSANSDITEIVLEKFDDYWGGAPDILPVDSPCVDGVVFRVIPDTLTRMAALRAGEIDISQSIPLDMVNDLNKNPAIQVRTAPGTSPKWIELSVNSALFDDVRVRQALNYAVDKQSIIEEVYDGQALALPGPMSPSNNFVDDDLQPYPYDSEKALSLLSEAGWTDSDDDGILDKDGQPFVFTIDTLSDWRPLAEAAALQFKTIGIDVDVLVWELGIIRSEMRSGERMAFLEDWGDSTFDPVGHFEAKWHGYVEDELYGRGNFSGYNNERVNELIRLGEITSDPDDRHAVYDEAQGIVYEDAPAVFLVLPDEIEAASVRIQNWEPSSDGRINLHDVCITP